MSKVLIIVAGSIIGISIWYYVTLRKLRNRTDKKLLKIPPNDNWRCCPKEVIAQCDYIESELKKIPIYANFFDIATNYTLKLTSQDYPRVLMPSDEEQALIYHHSCMDVLDDLITNRRDVMKCYLINQTIHELIDIHKCYKYHINLVYTFKNMQYHLSPYMINDICKIVHQYLVYNL